MTRSSIIALVAVSGALSACNAQSDAQGEESAVPSQVSQTAAVRYSGFSEPERVLYDAARDRYLVSNVNGETAAKDGNGFISVLSPDGSISDLEWIKGGEAGVTLHAPKGLAIAGGVLYVADIDVVRKFDAETGKALGQIDVPGSTFLNGLTAAGDDRLYLSDSGPPLGFLDGYGTEAVYVIEGDEVQLLAEGPLGRPTSLQPTQGGVIVASFGASEVFEIDDHGNKGKVSQLPAGGLAGIVKHGPWLYATSWQASAIFRGKLGEPFEVAAGGLAAPSDLGYDSKRGRLLVPHLTENTVAVLELQ
ncbi:SMP-30/gluconolactonase/LRE family protein [Sorangium sp. So ce1099]|uniref:SMP-30/gluconolactonase/LRE family protein n=1 Tax=Sorangium sp. So ce1099 TaxID=3133331 RepID=UPI003F630DF1